MSAATQPTPPVSGFAVFSVLSRAGQALRVAGVVLLLPLAWLGLHGLERLTRLPYALGEPLSALSVVVLVRTLLVLAALLILPTYWRTQDLTRQRLRALPARRPDLRVRARLGAYARASLLLQLPGLAALVVRQSALDASAAAANKPMIALMALCVGSLGTLGALTLRATQRETPAPAKKRPPSREKILDDKPAAP